MVHSAENMLVHPDRQYGKYYGETPSAQTAQKLNSTGGALPKTPQTYNRLRRRQSRELVMMHEESNQMKTCGLQEVSPTVTEELISTLNERRKPEQMRSISEDSGSKSNVSKPVTRRSLSHPEKESQVCQIFFRMKINSNQIHIRPRRTQNRRRYQVQNLWRIFQTKFDQQLEFLHR